MTRQGIGNIAYKQKCLSPNTPFGAWRKTSEGV